MSLVNRIFTGAAIGWGCIFASLLFASTRFFAKHTISNALQSICLSAFCVYFIIANWALAQPWVASQKAQTGIIYLMKQKKGVIQHPDSVLLADCPRYVMWSPVFDGVWDFQSMTRSGSE